MTTREARGMSAAQTEDESVARYLQHNPEFFERHSALLARMRLPHARSGATISLIERQVEVLREREAAAEQRLAEFVKVARANDAVAEKIHRLTRRLLRAPTRAAMLEQIEASLREDFDAFNSVLVLIEPRGETPPQRFIKAVAGSDPNLKSFESLFSNGKPRCGQARDSQREFLFGADAQDMGSVALVPLGEKASPLGLLALGSADRDRFHPGMSTEFLARVGDLITEALARA
ncbi:MAG TPA: DUF484 family protein [Steroidobacteraceae bacterium]|nr:DUF484 family protein [Steroidobacteraceae bacterium]